MENLDLAELFIRPLHEAGVPYMVSGSLASMHYGEPRLTMDVDLVVHLEKEGIAGFLELFPEIEFYRPPEEVLLVELGRQSRGHFNLIHLDTGFKADCYPSRNHPFWSWAWEHRRQGQLGTLSAWMAPPEYVIFWKLEFYREGGGDKHLRDIRGILAISGAELDIAFLDRATGELGLAESWALARRI